MRFSPTKILQGLLCSTPVLVLTLAACGGGGGSDTATFAAAYTVGGTVSGVNAAGLVLRNNGGDDKAISSADATYTFNTSVIAGRSYSVTVLSNPGNRLCSVDPVAASGVMPAYNITTANVTCVPAHTIGGSISFTGGATTLGSGLLLQNNGDNLLVPAGATSGTSFTFSTPVADGTSYSVTLLANPNSPAQLCTLTSASGTVASSNITTVSISCAADPTPAADRFAYTANYGDGNVSAFAIAASGVLSPSNTQSAGTEPSAIASDAASHVYATNLSSNTISGFSITGTNGSITPLSDVDAGTSGNQGSIPTGPTPVAIKIHPSGKFAYVVNSGSGSAADTNSISAYSIDASTGALARIDTDGTNAGTQYYIKARVTPNSITINSAGTYAYVTNGISNNITVYNIDPTSGALSEINSDANTGNLPYSIALAGGYAYVANGNDGNVGIYPINSDGTLDSISMTLVAAGSSPRSVKIDPSGTHVYVVNSASNDISAYTISGATLNQINCTTSGVTGVVCALGNTKNFLAGSAPKSISIDSSGKYAYVANSGGTTVSGFSIDISGALVPVSGSPFTTGTTPYSVITVK